VTQAGHCDAEAALPAAPAQQRQEPGDREGAVTEIFEPIFARQK